MRLVGRQQESQSAWNATKQSRRLAPECRDGAGLDLGLSTIPESRPVYELMRPAKTWGPQVFAGLDLIKCSATAGSLLASG
jgi:hypothetical protein